MLRANYAAALVGGKLSSTGRALDALALAQRHGHAEGLDSVLRFYTELLCGTRPSSGRRDQLKVALGPRPRAEPETVRRAVVLLLVSPEAQLG
jgi:hypothetical protein